VREIGNLVRPNYRPGFCRRSIGRFVRGVDLNLFRCRPNRKLDVESASLSHFQNDILNHGSLEAAARSRHRVAANRQAREAVVAASVFTLAPEMAAPDASFTVPSSSARSICAHAPTQAIVRKNKARREVWTRAKSEVKGEEWRGRISLLISGKITFPCTYIRFVSW